MLLNIKKQYSTSSEINDRKFWILFQVEFIVMGGTFMCLDESYKDYFIKNLHDALSGHCSNNVDEAVRYN